MPEEPEQMEVKELAPEGEVLPALPIDIEIPLWKRPGVRAGGIIAFLLGLSGWLLTNFFQVRGFVSIPASRIDLYLAAVLVIAVVWILARNIQRPRIGWPIAISVLILALACGLDRLTMPPNEQPGASVNPCQSGDLARVLTPQGQRGFNGAVDQFVVNANNFIHADYDLQKTPQRFAADEQKWYSDVSNYLGREVPDKTYGECFAKLHTESKDDSTNEEKIEDDLYGQAVSEKNLLIEYRQELGN